MDLRVLPPYLKWANHRAWMMLLRNPSASADIMPILTHLLAAEQIWAARVNGSDLPVDVWPSDAWPRGALFDDTLYNDLAGEVETGSRLWRLILREHCRDEVISYHNSKGQAFTSTVGDIALHVFAHGAYHRGQISQLVRAAGGEILDTDFIFYRRL